MESQSHFLKCSVGIFRRRNLTLLSFVQGCGDIFLNWGIVDIRLHLLHMYKLVVGQLCTVCHALHKRSHHWDIQHSSNTVDYSPCPTFHHWLFRNWKPLPPTPTPSRVPIPLTTLFSGDHQFVLGIYGSLQIFFKIPHVSEILRYLSLSDWISQFSLQYKWSTDKCVYKPEIPKGHQRKGRETLI